MGEVYELIIKFYLENMKTRPSWHTNTHSTGNANYNDLWSLASNHKNSVLFDYKGILHIYCRLHVQKTLKTYGLPMINNYSVTAHRATVIGSAYVNGYLRALR